MRKPVKEGQKKHKKEERPEELRWLLGQALPYIELAVEKDILDAPTEARELEAEIRVALGLVAQERKRMKAASQIEEDEAMISKARRDALRKQISGGEEGAARNIGNVDALALLITLDNLEQPVIVDDEIPPVLRALAGDMKSYGVVLRLLTDLKAAKKAAAVAEAELAAMRPVLSDKVEESTGKPLAALEEFVRAQHRRDVAAWLLIDSGEPQGIINGLRRVAEAVMTLAPEKAAACGDLTPYYPVVDALAKQEVIEPPPKPTITPPVCLRCRDSGTVDTGNNEYPCECGQGDAKLYNVAGMGTISGAGYRRALGMVE